MNVKLFFTSILFLFFNSVSFGQSIFPYRLLQPEISHQLPQILNEISGLTDLDSSRVACVQDELGMIFVYNFKTGVIESQHAFDSIGDFEGLTYTKQALYILRSDGRMTEWKGFPNAKGPIEHFNLPLVTSNNEGLCFDSKNKQLLIAAKSKPMNHDEKSERYIYAFDLSTHALKEKPLYSLNVESLEGKARAAGIQQTDTNAKGMVKPFNFRPASLAIHPFSDVVYIISAADKMLVVMNRKGDVLHVEPLPGDRFAKAEGITFLHDGTMIITNEAAGKAPTLYVFKMQ